MRNNTYPLREYRKPEHGEQFVLAGDPAESNDFCAAVAVSKKYYDFPIVFNDIIESAQFGYELHNIAKYLYNTTGMYPKIAVERNTGAATIFVLKQLNYPDLFHMVDFTANATYEHGNVGWLTTGHWSGGELQGTRRKMLDDLALAIRQGVVKFYDEQQIRQLMSFAIIKGRGQAQRNKKDDLVIATSIAWQVQMITPTQYLDDFDRDEFRKNQEKWRFK